MMNPRATPCCSVSDSVRNIVATAASPMTVASRWIASHSGSARWEQASRATCVAATFGLPVDMSVSTVATTLRSDSNVAAELEVTTFVATEFATAESGVITEAATTPDTEAGSAAELGVQTTNSVEVAAGTVDTVTDRDGIEIETWTGKADPGAVVAELEVAEPVTTVVTAVLEVAATGPEVAVVTPDSNELETGTPPSGEVEVNAASVKESNSTSSAGLPASNSGKTSSLAGLAGRETTVADRDATERREERGRHRLEERVDSAATFHRTQRPGHHLPVDPSPPRDSLPREEESNKVGQAADEVCAKNPQQSPRLDG
ncbi:unnamed protein product [Phytophthora fragariaefolia]|uniref:Unnamed protein product n=1 Tax=Phytophthora fragariaefolia TaxID=1490495 RepID=A0A9W6X9E8_9STRA|nr:unnamed protein product [Phytophthora fragariaefolia]